MSLVYYSMATGLGWIFVFLTVPHIVPVYLAYIMKQLRDMKARGGSLAILLLAQIGDSLFLRRQSRISYNIFYIIRFIIVLQGPWVARARPLPNQSLQTGLESWHSDKLPRKCAPALLYGPVSELSTILPSRMKCTDLGLLARLGESNPHWNPSGHLPDHRNLASNYYGHSRNLCFHLGALFTQFVGSWKPRVGRRQTTPRR